MVLEQVAELLEPQEVAHPQPQLGPVDGLGEELLDPRTQCRQTCFAVVQGRQHDDRDVPGGRVSLDCAGHLPPVDPGHQEVQQDQVRAVLCDGGQRLLAAAGGPQGIALGRQQSLKQSTIVTLVIDDKDAGGRFHD